MQTLLENILLNLLGICVWKLLPSFFLSKSHSTFFSVYSHLQRYFGNEVSQVFSALTKLKTFNLSLWIFSFVQVIVIFMGINQRQLDQLFCLRRRFATHPRGFISSCQQARLIQSDLLGGDLRYLTSVEVFPRLQMSTVHQCSILVVTTAVGVVRVTRGQQ